MIKSLYLNFKLTIIATITAVVSLPALAIAGNDSLHETGFVEICRSIKLIDGVESVDNAIANMDSTTLSAATQQAADILFDPLSPYCNDEIYINVAEHLLSSGRLGLGDSLRTNDALARAMMNRVGQKATDFMIVDDCGERYTLSDAVKRSPMTVLIFYDPDCSVCSEFEHQLASILPAGIGVVMIGTNNDEYSGVLVRPRDLPDDWIVGQFDDSANYDEDFYDIRITPTVLLLDSSGIVLDKNLTGDNIAERLSRFK